MAPGNWAPVGELHACADAAYHVRHCGCKELGPFTVQQRAVSCTSLPLQYVPTVEEIDSTIKIAGGINSPLIIKVTDSYGRVQRQLCKCNDDLRQVCQTAAGPHQLCSGGQDASAAVLLAMHVV